MTEIELKFQIPPARRKAVLAAVSTAASKRLRLQARYFDTADRRLAGAGLALRVRKEGRRWVQTLKGAGDGVWQRLEHEVPLAVAAGAVPLADLGLHDGTPAGDALRKALGDGLLEPIYSTDVMRTTRLLAARGCSVELACDLGALSAGERRWPLCEIEFELKSGTAPALADVAGRWAARFGLTLDTRTKAERGDRLARGERLGAPVKATALVLPPQVDSHAALRAVVGNCLAQVLGNASDLAHEEAGDPEHLHQLRVGLRRLRTALRELDGMSPQLEPRWAEAAAQLFARMGSARDRDALAQTLLPELHKAGAEGLELPRIVAEPAAQAALREPATTALWLELIAFAAGDSAGAQPFAPLVAERLSKLLDQVRRGAAKFGKLDDTARHRLRKRVKRLRYLSEFAAPLFRAKDVAAFLKRLAPAQQMLGEFNDVCVARALFEPVCGEDRLAMFALGWLARERDDSVRRCVSSLKSLRSLRPFW